MEDKEEGYQGPSRVFRPRWKVHFHDGAAFPVIFNGIHLGTVADHKALNDKRKAQKLTKPFDPEWDIIFIDNYVFEYCERADAAITFDIANGLPESLNLSHNIGIHVSCLSMDKHDVWCKKLRFILRNFPKVKRITIIATVILDIASPECIQKPFYFTDIQNISLQDRIRYGILFGEELPLNPHCTETSRPSDFAIKAWNHLSRHWPTWGKRKENGTAPCMYMTAMVYFRKEWINLDGVGGPGRLCELGNQQLDVAGVMVKNELRKALTAEIDQTRNMGAGPSLKKKTSFLTLGPKKVKMPLKERPSMPTIGDQATSLVEQI